MTRLENLNVEVEHLGLLDSGLGLGPPCMVQDFNDGYNWGFEMKGLLFYVLDLHGSILSCIILHGVHNSSFT